MANTQKMESFKRLSPLEAMQVWLDGDFGIDEEPALCTAIRKDPRITLSDDDIIDRMVDAMEEDCDAATCLVEHLAAAK